VADHRLRRLAQRGDQMSDSDRGDGDKGTKVSWISWSRRAKWGSGCTEPGCTSPTAHMHDRGAIAVNRLACWMQLAVENVPHFLKLENKGRSCMRADSLVIFLRVADDWLEGIAPSESEPACMFSFKSLASDWEHGCGSGRGVAVQL
jgi:hypothetical protein